MSTKRDTKEIRIWMIRQGVREKDIILATGKEQSYVNKTLRGKRNCREVLSFLEQKGCPAEYLGLPERRA